MVGTSRLGTPLVSDRNNCFHPLLGDPLRKWPDLCVHSMLYAA